MVFFEMFFLYAGRLVLSLKHIDDLLEYLLLLFNLESGVALVAVAAPPPPTLHVIRRHEVWEPGQGAGDGGSETMPGYGVPLEDMEIAHE